MDFRVSHVFREGNSVVDNLANYVADHTDSHWWDSCLSFLFSLIVMSHDFSWWFSYLLLYIFKFQFGVCSLYKEIFIQFKRHQKLE